MAFEKLRFHKAEIRILDIDALKAHERIIPDRVRKIKSDLERSGEIRMPLWVEKDHFVVLNGHHRLAALKKLGCTRAPVVLFDYFSDEVQVGVCPGAKIASIDKRSIIEAALAGMLFPARSSLHSLRAVPASEPTLLSELMIGGMKSQRVD